MRKQSRVFRAKLAKIAGELWCGSAGWEQEREELTAKICRLEGKLISETGWVNAFKKELMASRQEVLAHEMALDINRKYWRTIYGEKDDVIERLQCEVRNIVDLSSKRGIWLIVMSASFFTVSVWAVLECLVIHGVVK